ncbi:MULTISPECIES: beta-ketoacyl-ACP synthase II [Clostridium]|jgi:3-oxoacyl-[acyl-carrier-protein] synthase II|uniref:3-oxoacyl-[acyl-carrier-protein] synthase 2 n=2 Tax=root TaxID=1 RepID=R9CBB3_9CLOT|nr:MULTISPECIES: beta-ketoacyl-ACP synthase II [Clostridium]EOR26295.1 3-oxoacyl-(acyl-carrier-protein) synthase II [Clostridium sartagoforme AAU1]KLE16680.1 3-oxoacyl-ACP synthase [Clostridium sp. C8]
MKRRVVITGLGAITPIGNSIESFWNSVKEGKNGIDNITFFDTTEFKVKVAAEVKDFKAEDYISKKDAKRLDRYTQLALVAAKECIKDSNIDLEKVDRERFGVIFGSGIGGLTTMEKQIRTLEVKGPSRVGPLTIPQSISNMAAGSIAIEFGILGTCLSVTTACATSTHCIGEAYRSIKDGYLDRAIVGGSEASINEFGISAFQSLTALSKSEDRNRASIPFDKDRNGFVMGEGAGALLLEDLESALARGAKIYGEVVGYGTTCDAYHITSPSSDGDGAYRAMRDAIKDANISPSEISYINAHGTSTEINDKVETIAIKKAFGDFSKEVYVSSTKAMTGHLLGAAGAIEAIICIKALGDDFIPANINYLNPDEECDLNIVINEGKKEEVEYALSNSLGFGGHNGTVIFKKWRER